MPSTDPAPVEALPRAAAARLTRLATRMLSATAATIALVADDGAGGLALAVGGVRGFRRDPRPSPELAAFCAEVVGTARRGAIPAAWPGLPLEPQEPCVRRHAGVALCGVPLVSRGRAVGVLCVHDTASRVWSDADKQLLCDLSASVVAEIEATAAARRAERHAAALTLAVDDLREAEERFRIAFDHAPHGVVMAGSDGRFIRLNRSFCATLGHSEGELLGTSFLDVTHPEDREDSEILFRQLLEGRRDHFDVEKRCLRRDGSEIWCMVSVVLVRDRRGEPRYTIAHLVDLTDRKQAERELERLADRDPLTGLLNRRRFAAELAARAQRARRGGPPLALVLLDLDNFKAVNDTLGHAAGDEVLIGVARALHGALASGDVVGRLGGDEFAILLAGVDAQRAAPAAERLVGRVRAQDFAAARGLPLHVTASAGVTVLEGDDPRDDDQLLVDADAAMYGAKGAGGDCACLSRRLPGAVRAA